MFAQLALATPVVFSLAMATAAAQSNPYVAVYRFESGTAPEWGFTNAHLAAPHDCGNASYALALNDGPGTCLFGGLVGGQEYRVSRPGLRYHPTQPMEFFYSYRNALPAPAFVEIAGYGPAFGSFIVDFTDNTGGNDGSWHDKQRMVWSVSSATQGAVYSLVVRVFDTAFTPGPGGYYLDNVVVRPRMNGFVFCDGNGGCPCLNNAHSGGPDGGCRNSTGKGAWLSGYGSTSLTTDEIEFVSAGLLPGELAWLFHGAVELQSGNGIPFGLGLLCVGGGLQRLGIQSPDHNGIATWRNVAGLAGWVPGQPAFLQVYYRDAMANACGPLFNTTNGFRFTPGT